MECQWSQQKQGGLWWISHPCLISKQLGFQWTSMDINCDDGLVRPYNAFVMVFLFMC